MKKYRLYAIVAVITLLWTGCGQSANDPVFELDENEEKTETASAGEEDLKMLLEEILEENLASLKIDPVIQVTCNCTGETQVQQIVESSIPMAQADEGKININTADVTALQTLNGIGESRAQAIVSYRESFGAFQTIEDIKQVDGIKDGIFSKIQDEISVG